MTTIKILGPEQYLEMMLGDEDVFWFILKAEWAVTFSNLRQIKLRSRIIPLISLFMW